MKGQISEAHTMELSLNLFATNFSCFRHRNEKLIKYSNAFGGGCARSYSRRQTTIIKFWKIFVRTSIATPWWMWSRCSQSFLSSCRIFEVSGVAGSLQGCVGIKNQCFSCSDYNKLGATGSNVEELARSRGNSSWQIDKPRSCVCPLPPSHTYMHASEVRSVWALNRKWVSA